MLKSRLLVLILLTSTINICYADELLKMPENPRQLKEGRPALAGEETVPPLVKWTDQEQWVWKKIALGEEADLANPDLRLCLIERQIDIKEEGVPDRYRILTPDFISTILQHEPWKGATPSSGVQIRNAHFAAPIELASVELSQDLYLKNCSFDKPVNLSETTLTGTLSFEGSTFESKLNLNSTHITQHLLMNKKAMFKEVDLYYSNIGGIVNMDESSFNGKINMYSSRIGQHLLMRKVIIDKEVNLYYSIIGGMVSMEGASINGRLDMNGTRIGQHLLMDDGTILDNGATFKAIDLIDAKIAGKVRMDASTFGGKLDMNSIYIGLQLSMGNLATFNKVNLRNAKINGQLDISGSTFNDTFDLSSAEINELKMSRFEDTNTTTWGDKASLFLSNAHVSQLPLPSNVWKPGNVNLTGFTYDNIFQVGNSDKRLPPDSSKIISWLETYSMDSSLPYQQAAKVLEAQGDTNGAQKILFAARERERLASDTKWTTQKWLLAKKITIGYGYRLEKAIYFLFGLWLLGLTVLAADIAWVKCHELDRVHSLNNSDDKVGAWFVLDRLLPLIELNALHKDIQLGWLSKRIFYGLRLGGFFLATMLAAGLSGFIDGS